MKKTLKVLGIIALAAIIGFTMTSCGKSGGSVIIENESNYDIWAFVIPGSRNLEQLSTFALTEANRDLIEEEVEEIDADDSNSWSFSEDGTVTWMWVYMDGPNKNRGRVGTVSLSKGEDETIKADGTSNLAAELNVIAFLGIMGKLPF
jgi:hypothetical protein